MRRVANRPWLGSSPGYDVFLHDRVVRPSRRSLPEPKVHVGKGGANRPKQLSCHRKKIGGPVSSVGVHDVTARLSNGGAATLDRTSGSTAFYPQSQ